MKAFKLCIFLAVVLQTYAGVGFATPPSMTNTYTTDCSIQVYNIQDSFTSSTKGINSVFVNPAGIAKSSTFEISLGYGADLSAKSFATFTASDEDLGQIGGGSGFFKGGLYFTDDRTDTSTIEFKSRDINANFDYERSGGLTDFAMAFNFGDVFAFGVTRMRPSSLDINMTGYVPTIFKNTMDMHDQSFGGLTIESDGRAAFSGGGVTFETAEPLYDKFTMNSTDAAVSTIATAANSASDNREIALTIGGDIWGIKWGVNAIPISSDIVLNNTAYTRVASNSADMVYYVPNFDPTDPASIAAWANEGTKIYSSREGYVTYTFELSPEANIYRGVAQGNYSASAMRVDLGFMWEPIKNVNVSAVYENIGGANLVYKGTGVRSTVESYINKNDPPDFNIGSSETYNPLVITPEALEGASGFYLPDEFTVVLPRKGKIGISTRVPFFIAVDYERYFTNIEYAGTTVTDLGFLKVGMESLLFGLPLVVRGESTWLLKPTILGITDPGQRQDINDFLDKYPALPTESKFGLGFKMYGYELGGDFMENHTSLLAIYQGNMLDFMKMISYDLYLRADNWDVTYTAVGEPLYLLAQNADLLNPNVNQGEISASDIKTNWVYSIKVGYRF